MQMTVRLLSSSEPLNVMVFYLMTCTLAYSTIGCLFTWRSLITPVSAQHVALLVSQGLFGYGNQVRWCVGWCVGCCRSLKSQVVHAHMQSIA